MEMFRMILLLLFALPAWNTLSAQACCSGGVPISGNLGLASSTPGDLQLQLTYDHNTLRDLLTVSEVLDDRSRTRKTLSLMLESSYDLSPRFSTSALVPFVRQERLIQTLSGTEDFTANHGLGDIIFLVRYNLISQNAYARVNSLQLEPAQNFQLAEQISLIRGELSFRPIYNRGQERGMGFYGSIIHWGIF